MSTSKLYNNNSNHIWIDYYDSMQVYKIQSIQPQSTCNYTAAAVQQNYEKREEAEKNVPSGTRRWIETTAFIRSFNKCVSAHGFLGMDCENSNAVDSTMVLIWFAIVAFSRYTHKRPHISCRQLCVTVFAFESAQFINSIIEMRMSVRRVTQNHRN